DQDLLEGRDRVDEELARAQPRPAVAWGLDHVASPSVVAVISVSWATSWRAVSLSRQSMLIGPAADAVVTVRDARSKSRMMAPCRESTVWIRLMGAMRDSRPIQPERVCTATGVTSQRCTR